ncbi:hypothetical protein ABE096_05530 [Robertmurraya massiliosenegalensis]
MSILCNVVLTGVMLAVIMPIHNPVFRGNKMLGTTMGEMSTNGT